MSSFAKIHGSIFTGSLRGKADPILVFVNILTHTTADGIADIHPNTIVDETGIPKPRVTKAIDVLSSPDPESRSPACEGRRIVLLEPSRKWGWRVVNHELYRNSSGDDRYRLKTNERVKRHRHSQVLKSFYNVTETLRNATHIVTHDTVSVSVPVPSSSDQDRGTGEGKVDPDENIRRFDAFWKLYPKKVMEEDTKHAWFEVEAYHKFAEIISALQRHVISEQWTKDNGRYIPNPANWLRFERWKDTLAVGSGNKQPWDGAMTAERSAAIDRLRAEELSRLQEGQRRVAC